MPAVFAEIGADHAFGPVLGRFRDRLAERPAPAGHERYSEVRGRRGPDGWTLDRFYCSRQHRTGDPGRPFTASTLYWSARTGAPRWFDFPAEPYLGAAADWLGARRYDVLRYVPLRRLTVRSGGEVVKFKRRTRLADSWSRVCAVAAAAAGGPVRVPAPLRSDGDRCAYAQRAVEGPSMDRLVDVRTVADLLAEAGRVHAELHALRCPGLPVQDPLDVARAVATDADWLAVLRPRHAPAVRRLRRRLLADPPAPAPAVTCHGDLVPSHLIDDGTGWTVIDLDLAHRGDPHRDVATFLTGLPADLRRPELADRAAAAYLAGYAGRGAGHRLDGPALAWHLAAADLHQLAVAAAKDRLVPEVLDATLTRLDEGGRR